MSKEWIEDIRKSVKKSLQELEKAFQERARLEQERAKIMTIAELIECGAIKNAKGLERVMKSLKVWGGKDE